MNRGTGLILMFLGVMLIYLSMYGLSAFPYQLGWSGNTYTDPFNQLDTSFWSIEKVNGADARFSGTFYADFSSITQQASVYLRSIQQYDFTNGGYVSLDLLGGDCRHIELQIGDGQNYYGVYMNLASGWYGGWKKVNGEMTRLGYNTGFTSYQGETLKITISSGSITLNIDGPYKWSATDTFSLSSYNLQAVIRITGDPGDTYGEVDNFALSYSGGTTPPPGTGTLIVQTYVDGQKKPPDNNKIFVNGQTYYTDSNGFWSQDVNPGSYTVSATYQDVTQTDTKTVYEGQTTTVQLSWGGQPPPSPPNILEWLRQFLNDPTTKSLMLVGGIGLLGIGFIMLVAPRGKRYYPPSTPQY